MPLTEEQKKQLDTNIRSMLENGASQTDVESYAKDFKAKYEPVEKKSEVGVVADTESQSSGSVTDLYKQGTTETPVTDLAAKTNENVSQTSSYKEGDQLAIKDNSGEIKVYTKKKDNKGNVVWGANTGEQMGEKEGNYFRDEQVVLALETGQAKPIETFKYQGINYRKNPNDGKWYEASGTKRPASEGITERINELSKTKTVEQPKEVVAEKIEETVEPVRQNKEAIMYERNYSDLPELVEQKKLDIAEQTKWKPTLSEQENLQLAAARNEKAAIENKLAEYKKTDEEAIVSGISGKEAGISALYENQIREADDKIYNLDITAKSRDKENYNIFYNPDNLKPIAVPNTKKATEELLSDFYDENFQWREDYVTKQRSTEFQGKKYSELSADQQAVVKAAFAEKYKTAEQIQELAGKEGLDYDLRKTPNLLNNAVKSAIQITGSIIEGADPSKMQVPDVLNTLIVKADNNMITKSEYERALENQKAAILSKVQSGYYSTQDKLPGLEPINEGYDPQSGLKTYTYTAEQMQSYLGKMPKYEDANSQMSPYKYEKGQLGDVADKVNDFAKTIKTNPVYKEDFGVKLASGVGSAVPFIVSTIASRGMNLPSALVTGLTGAFANASGAYNQAIEGGATPGQARLAYWGGMGIGASEAIPLERMMGRIGAGKGFVDRALKVVAQGSEEGLQELFQSLSNDELAKLLYDESLKVGETAGSDATIGFVTGVLMGGGAVLSKRPDVTPKQKELADKAAENIKKYIVERGDVAKEQAKINVEKPVVETKVEPEVVVAEEKIVEPVSSDGVDSVGGGVKLEKGNKIQWDVFGNEESGEWTVKEKTKTRGGKDAVVLAKVYVESSIDGKSYTKEYADANGIKYDNERTVEHIVPLEDLQTNANPTLSNGGEEVIKESVPKEPVLEERIVETPVAVEEKERTFEADKKQAEIDAKIEEKKKQLAEAKAKLPVKEEVKVEEKVVEEPKVEVEAAKDNLLAGKTFITHNNEEVSGEKLSAAVNKVADGMVESANKKREESYADHVTEKQKDDILAKDLKYAEEVRRGEHLNNLSVAQRINYELTGETLPILPKVETPAETVSAKEEKPVEQAPEQNPISERLSKYGWTVEPQGKDQVVRNSNGKIVATVKTKGAKYEIIGNDGAKLMSGNKNVAEAVEKVATKYFMAQEKVEDVKEDVVTGMQHSKSQLQEIAEKEGIDNAIASFKKDLGVKEKRLEELTKYEKGKLPSQKSKSKEVESLNKRIGEVKNDIRNLEIIKAEQSKPEVKPVEKVVEKAEPKKEKSFEEKHGVSIDAINKEVEEFKKLGIGNPIDMALTKLGFDTNGLALPVLGDYMKHIIEGELPKKLPNKKELFIGDYLPEGEIYPKPIDKPVQKLKDNTTKSKAESLKGIVNDDDMRPVMNGVYYDKENGFLVATDAHKLVKIKDANIEKQGVFDIKTGEEIEGKYPNYDAVIPENNPIKLDISIKELRPKLEGMERANRFFATDPTILARIEVGDNEYLFSPKLLNDILKVLEQHGHDKVTIELSTPTRALVIKEGDITALAMPIYTSSRDDVRRKSTIIERKFTEAEKMDLEAAEKKKAIENKERDIKYEQESIDDGKLEIAELEKEDIKGNNKAIETRKKWIADSEAKIERIKNEIKELQNDTTKPISETPANDAEAVVKGIESDANSESKSKRKRAIKTGTEVIDDKIASKKAELKARKANRGNLGILSNENENNAYIMKLYTDLAGLYIAKGVKSAIDFAKELGEDISDLIQEAWDKANNQPVEEIVEEGSKPEPKKPEVTEEEEPEEKEKALLNRAYKGATEEELKAAIEKHGLTYEVESWEAAKKKARALIDDIGIEAAVQAVKGRVVVGAPAAFVWGEAIDSIHNAIAAAETTEEIERLTKLEADLMSEFDKQAREQGRFISALQDVYANSDFQYDLETQIQKYKDNNKGVIPKEVEDKMREMSEQLKDIQAKFEEAKKRAEELEYAENVRNIQDSVNRDKGTPMSQAEIDAAIEKGVESELNKAMARLSDTRKKAAKKAIEALEKLDKSLTGMNFDATIGIPVAIVRGGIKTTIAGIKLTGKIADAIESGMKYIQEEYEKQFGKKLPISEYGRVKTFIKDNLKDAGLDVSNRKDKPIKEKDGKIVIPPALIRELVESGLTDPNELTQAVLEIVQKSLPEATERQVRDAISNYGRTVNQSQEDIDIEIRKIKRAQRIISALEDIANKKRPLRSGLQRDKLDAEERALQKQLKEALKTLPPDTELEAKQLKTTLDVIEKRLLNQIEDLQREIDTSSRAIKERKEIPYTERIKDLIAQRDAKKAEHEEIFGKTELTDEQRLERAIKAIDRAAANIEERIKKGELTITPRPNLTSVEKEMAKKRLADARAELAELQELAGIPEQKRLEQAKNNAKRRIAELQTKIDTGDFAKKKQKKIIKDDELKTLLAEKNRIQEKFNKLQYEAELKNRSRAQKIVDGILEVWGITRALRATAEFSFMLIQGGFYAVSHPLTAMKSLSLAFSHLLSTSRSERFAEYIKTQDWYEGAKEDKLAITEVDYKLSAREELFLNGWVNHIWDVIGLPLKLVSEKAFQRWKLASFPKAFERSNVGAMNLVRITRYLKGVEMLEAQGKTRETHPQDYKNVADMVNTFTGRATLGGLENNKATSKLLTTLFFSPKMWASTIKTFTPYAFFHFGKMSSAEFENTGNLGKDKKVGKRQVSVAQKMAMADYMKFVGLTTSVVMALALKYNNDDDDETSVELDPRSSDFLKIRLGNTRIDPWGGRIQMIVLQARLLAESMNRTGITKDLPSYKRTSSGELTRLGEGYTDTMGGLLSTMTKNKLAPSAALVNQWLFAKLDKEGNTVDKFGNEYEPSEELVNSLYPIYIETIKELYEDQPQTVATFLTFYAFLGGGAQTYQPTESKTTTAKPIKPIEPIKPVKPVKSL